jgi:CNT family concentrative nucleoside transporter
MGQSLVGQWRFEKIYSDTDSAIKVVMEGDHMMIQEDRQFHYSLKHYGLFASGRWSLKEDTLVFFYDQPLDTVRFYSIEVLDEENLEIMEGAVRFRWSKENQETLIAQNPSSDTYQSKFQWTYFFRGMLGLLVLVFISYLFSRNRKAINWSLVAKGLGIQFIFALLILKVELVKEVFEWLSAAFVVLLSFTQAGSEFLFGGLVEADGSLGYIFAFQVLPTIVFFSALTSVLFYFGVLQKIVYGFAWLMKRSLKLSGAESLAAAGNIFLGQTESPLLIKPYIDRMTRSELLCLMSGGMATIAGGVLAAYIGFLGGSDPESQIFFAKHLLAASLMSAPAAVVAAKILVPETEGFDQNMTISQENLGTNILEAISKGTIQGLRLAVNVGAMLLVFLAFIAMVNYFLDDFIGSRTGLNTLVSDWTNGQYDGLTLEFLLGYLLAPITWLMGIAKEDMVLVGQLLGEKTILNEFVAYVTLGELKAAGAFAQERSVIIATYILCGFANFASIGIQIGGIGSLAPKRTPDLSKLGFLALVGGTMASLFTAVIVGMLI